MLYFGRFLVHKSKRKSSTANYKWPTIIKLRNEGCRNAVSQFEIRNYIHCFLTEIDIYAQGTIQQNMIKKFQELFWKLNSKRSK